MTNLKRLVSPEHFIAVRNRFGGPAPEPMHEALAAYRDRAAAFANLANTQSADEAKATRELNDKFQALVEKR